VLGAASAKPEGKNDHGVRCRASVVLRKRKAPEGARAQGTRREKTFLRERERRGEAQSELLDSRRGRGKKGFGPVTGRGTKGT